MAGRQDVFQEAMNQGHSAAWDQNWDRAAVFYRQALEEFPEHPQALTNLGLALIELQDFEGALECYQHAAAVSPDDPIPMEKAAQLFERMGDLDPASQASLRAAEKYLNNREVNKAIENWERVTRLSPENIHAYTRLALVYERLGDKEKAVPSYLALASLFQAAGNMEKAVSAAKRALTIQPDSPEAAQALAYLKETKPLPKPERPRGGTAPLRMSQVRQLEATSDGSQEEAGLDPIARARQRALMTLAGILFEGTEKEDGGEEGSRGLQAIVSGGASAQRTTSTDHTRIVLHLSQVVDLQTQGDNIHAADELERAMEFGLENPAANFDLGYLYMQNGRLESALRQLQFAVHHQDFALGTRLLLGDLFYQKGQVGDAAIEYLEALKLADVEVAPEDWDNDLRQLYEPIIDAERRSTNLEAQEQLCDNIKKILIRQDWRAQVQLARKQLPNFGNGNAPPVPLAEILTQAHSSHVIEALSHIYELSGTGNLRSAMEEAFFALDHAPTYLPLHTYIGDMLMQQGNIQEAAAKYLTVAKTYSSRGESTQSINLYRKITVLSPMDLTARGRLIDHLIAAGQEDEAIEEYLNMAEMYYNLADLRMSRKTYTEALRLAQEARADRAIQVTILHHMADMDLQSLEWRQALRIFEQIRTLQPDDLKANSNLVALNFRMGREDQAKAELDNYLTYLIENNQIQTALTALEELVEEYPKRAPIRRSLAEVYEQLGRKEEAVTQLDALGEILMEAGDRAGATLVIQRILSLDPPNKAEYQQLLDQLQ
jgi:tetratricopeptide (TPR) repeat protein